MPKCTRRGWYLPYTPADNEYGAWKRHYVACILTLDMNAPSKNRVKQPFKSISWWEYHSFLWSYFWSFMFTLHGYFKIL